MNNKYIKIGLIITISLIYVFLSYNSALLKGDFHVYLDAAQKLQSHQNIYTPPFYGGLQYYYSPFFALSLIPFTTNFFITEFLWLLLSGYLFYRTIILILHYFDLTILSKKETTLLVIISLFFVLRFFLYNTNMIQITPFLLWAIFESISLLNKKKEIAGAALLALVINIKLLPIIIIPYLLYRGKLKSVFYVIIFSVLFLFLPSLFLGHQFNLFLLSEWWQIINPLKGEHLVETDTNFQSITAMITIFFSETKGEMNIARNMAVIPIETSIYLANLIRIALITLTVYFLEKPFKKTTKLTELRGIGYICLLVPLIFPHQQKYAFIFILPVIMYLTYYAFINLKFGEHKKFKIYLILLILPLLVFTPIIGADIIGRYSYDIIHYYRFLGLCTLFLIFLLIIWSPQKIKKLLESKSTTK